MKTQTQTDETTKRKITATQVITLCIGVCLITFGGVRFYSYWQTTHQRVVIPSTAPSSTNQQPSEYPIPTDKKSPPPFTYRPDQPKLISISSASIQGYIQQVGIDDKNAVGVPSNINLAGWYTKSVKPGEKGLSIIDGHVSGRYSPAIFKNLKQVKNGDAITITYGDNSTKKFVVTSTQTLSVEQASQQLFQQDPVIERQLTLITCGGTFNKSDQSFDRRVIVTSKFVP